MERAEIGPDGQVAGVTRLEHPADVALDVVGPTLEACLARAGVGMFALMVAPAPEACLSTGPTGDVVDVRVAAPDPPQLMHAWLEELLVRSDTEGTVFVRCEVELTDGGVHGRVHGLPADDPRLEPVGPAVKGVTWHGLQTEAQAHGWRAQVLLDV